MITSSLICLAILLLWLFRRKDSSGPKSLHSYFVHAVKVYALLGEQEAKTAALAASNIATTREQKHMLDYLNKRASELLLETGDTNVAGNRLTTVERLVKLEEEVRVQNANEIQPAIAMAHKDLDTTVENGGPYQAYLDALERTDHTIFIQQHPDLFDAKITQTPRQTEDDPD